MYFRNTVHYLFFENQLNITFPKNSSEALSNLFCSLLNKAKEVNKRDQQSTCISSLHVSGSLAFFFFKLSGIKTPLTIFRLFDH